MLSPQYIQISHLSILMMIAHGERYQLYATISSPFIDKHGTHDVLAESSTRHQHCQNMVQTGKDLAGFVQDPAGF